LGELSCVNNQLTLLNVMTTILFLIKCH
jgi:hypothetical protein